MKRLNTGNFLNADFTHCNYLFGRLHFKFQLLQPILIANMIYSWGGGGGLQGWRGSCKSLGSITRHLTLILSLANEQLYVPKQVVEALQGWEEWDFKFLFLLISVL